MMCFVNFSNHESKLWCKEQIKAAEEYGPIVDFKFPNVEPEASEEDIKNMALRISHEILEMHPLAVMCQGEFTLCFEVVYLLKRNGIKVLSSCTERKCVIDNKDGVTVKTAVFEFKGFREYLMEE